MIESNYLELLKQYMISMDVVALFDNVVFYILANQECIGDGFDRIITATIVADDTLNK